MIGEIHEVMMDIDICKNMMMLACMMVILEGNNKLTEEKMRDSYMVV